MFKSEIMVSIVISTYNHEKYIEQAIKGVLIQKTNFRFEVLVGEDHSTDGTALVLKRLECTLPENFHIYYRTNNYGSKLNNIDLYNKAKGKYLILLEGDDYWIYEYKLQKQVDFLETNNDYVAVAHNTLVVDKNSKIREDYVYPECKNEEYTIDDFGEEILMGQSTTILYRNYIRDKLFEDIPVSVRYPGDRRKNFLLVTHGRVKCIQEIWSAYRYVDDEGTSYSANVKNDKTFAHRELIFYRELMEYAKTELQIEKTEMVTQNMYLISGLSTCIHKKNPDYSWHDWIKDFKKAKYKASFVKYFVKCLKRKVFRSCE